MSTFRGASWNVIQGQQRSGNRRLGESAHGIRGSQRRPWDFAERRSNGPLAVRNDTFAGDQIRLLGHPGSSEHLAEVRNCSYV